MTESISKLSIQAVKFDGTNWQEWKGRVRVALDANMNTYGFITGEEPELPEGASPKDQEKYNKYNNKMCRSTLLTMLDREHFLMCDRLESGREIWEYLVARYEPVARARQAALWKEFWKISMHEGEQMANYLARVKEAKFSLEDAHETVSV